MGIVYGETILEKGWLKAQLYIKHNMIFDDKCNSKRDRKLFHQEIEILLERKGKKENISFSNFL